MPQVLFRFLVVILAVCPVAAFASWQECNQEAPGDRFRCLSGFELENGGALDYDLALADAARMSGNNAYAAIVLERLVTLHPAQAGARLDLVIISLQAGDNLTAARHLKVLQGMPDPPPAVGSLLRRLERQLRPADQIFEKQTNYQATAGLGYDTNPNLGVVADAIDLVINGFPVTLIPDASLSPRGAFFTGISGGVDHSYSPRGVISATAALREYEGLEDQDSVAVAARLFHRVRSNRYIEAVLADFRTGEGLYLTRAGIGARQRFGDCRCSTLGLLVDFLDGSERSSRASRIRFEVETAREGEFADYFFYGSVGYDIQTQADWGNTLGLQLGAEAATRIKGFKAFTGISLYKGFDQDPYSPLFGGRQRDLLRGMVRAGVSRPVAPGMDVFLDVSWSRQESDIVLFEYERQLSAIGLRLRF